jgi:cytochrome c
MKVADARIGDRKAASCKACHTFDAGAPDMAGPNLHGVYGQPMGRNRPGFGYSPRCAMPVARGTMPRWTPG